MTTYSFSAFSEKSLLDAGDCNGWSLGVGDRFKMPGSADLDISVRDDDRYLSGDGWCDDRATDSWGQTANVGNGGQIYAEQYFWVCDQFGQWYVMIEIEQEGSNDSYFTFYTGGCYSVPPAGAELTVKSSSNVSGDWIDYSCLDAGDTTPPLGEIKGRLTLDDDGDNTEVNTVMDDNGSYYDEGFEGVTVQLVDKQGNVVAETTTDANGWYSFEVAAGEYRVKFPQIDGYKFAQKDVGHYGTDSDADANGLTDMICVTAGQTVCEVDASLQKNVGSIEGRVFCDTNCDGIDGAATVVPGETYVIEAEDMYGRGFITAHGAQASGGELVKLGSNWCGINDKGNLNTTFNGVAGAYDLTIRAQDECDGRSVIKVLVNGCVVDAIRLDRDTDGAGSDHGAFSAFTIEGVELQPGDKISLVVYRDGGEYVRIDNITLEGADQEIVSPEPPKEGITVRLLDANGVPVLDGDGRPITTLTDANGEYRFDNVPVGDYKVEFLNPDDGAMYTYRDVGDDDTIDSDVDANGVTGVITVKADKTTSDVDAGIKMCDDGLGSIAGRYFCDENRNDVDDGEPGIAGMTVVLTDAAGNFITDTVTDADGAYLFSDLPAGDYKVTFAPYQEPVDTTPPVPGVVQSDDFSSGVIQPYWTFVESPKVAGSSVAIAVTDIDAALCITVQPGDSDPYTVDGMNDAARLLQTIDDADFQVEVGFSSIPMERFELQGILVEQDADNWMRFDLRSNGSTWSIYAAYADDGASTIVLDEFVDDPSDYAALRVTRVGDDWTFETSADGVSWTPQASFSHAGIEPNAVGPFAGALAPENDGYTAKVDYFVNSQSPIDNEDGSLTLQTGKDFVMKDAGADDTIDSDVDANGMTDVISLASGENKTDVDAGVKGPATGVIGDTIWYDTFGDNRLNDFEQRASGVTVQLKDAGGSVIAETVTKLDGSYLFQNLEAGDYSVQVIRPDGFVFVDANVGDDARDSDFDPTTGISQTITLGEGESNLTIDGGLRACGLIEGSSQSDPYSPVGGHDLLIGCEGDDTIYAFSGRDTVRGMGGDDVIYGSFDNDLLEGGAGDDYIDGGARLTGGGNDTDIAVYSGVRADYAILTGDDGGPFTVRDLNTADGDDGFDTLLNVEILRFADGDFFL